MKVVKQPLFCPACAAPDVWTDEDDPGDYYAGTNYYCLTCHAALPDLGMVNKESTSLDRADSYSLEKCLAIRVGAQRSDEETERIRVLYAKASAELAERQRDEERRRALRDGRATQ